jgi:hypothetical protein
MNRKVYGKGKAAPGLNELPCHEDVQGIEGVAPSILTSAVDGGKWSASCPGHFTPREGAHGTHYRI